MSRDGGELAYLAVSDGAEAAAQEGRTDRVVYDGDGPDGIGRQRARRCHAVPRYVSADHEHVPAQLSAGSNGLAELRLTRQAKLSSAQGRRAVV
jgi:hypothetical protein